jgi:hypothetical protein
MFRFFGCLFVVLLSSFFDSGAAPDTDFSSARGVVRSERMRRSILNASAYVYNINKETPAATIIGMLSERISSSEEEGHVAACDTSATVDPVWEGVHVFDIALNSQISRGAGMILERAAEGSTLGGAASWWAGPGALAGVLGGAVLGAIEGSIELGIRKLMRIKDSDTNPSKISPTALGKHFGLVTYSGNDVLIAFRGTDSWESALVDLSIHSQDLGIFHHGELVMESLRTFFDLPIPGVGDGKSDIFMHRGFMREAISAQKEIFDFLRGRVNKIKEEQDKRLGAGSPIRLNVVVTGHSLGGALATVASCYLKTFLSGEILPAVNADPTKGITARPAVSLASHTLNLVTFGSPKVFLPHAAAVFIKKIPLTNILRVVTEGTGGQVLKKNVKDLVPFLSLTGEHVGDEYLIKILKQVKILGDTLRVKVVPVEGEALLVGKAIHSMNEYYRAWGWSLEKEQ